MRLEDVSRGATFADYDLDGDLDLVVTNSQHRTTPFTQRWR